MLDQRKAELEVSLVAKPEKDGMIGERKGSIRKAKRMRTEKEGSSRKMKKRKTAVLLAAVLCLELWIGAAPENGRQKSLILHLRQNCQIRREWKRLPRH